MDNDDSLKGITEADLRALTQRQAGWPEPDDGEDVSFWGGPNQQLLHGVCGDICGSDKDFWASYNHELRQEQEQWPQFFVRKLPTRKRTMNGVGSPGSRLLSAREFGRLYSAAAFAGAQGAFLSTHVTLSWKLLGLSEDVEVAAALKSFTKCLRDYLAERDQCTCWVYVHEISRRLGLHTHMIAHIPPNMLREFRAWAERTWRPRTLDPPISKKAIKVTARDCSMVGHWYCFHYLVKGYDRSDVIIADKDVLELGSGYLGDLIGWHWCDPGCVTMKQKIGISGSLGPSARQRGLPIWVERFDLDRPADPWQRLELIKQQNPGWANEYVDDEPVPLLNYRQPPSEPEPVPAYDPLFWEPYSSPFERGSRDVRELYGRQFCERVQGFYWSPAEERERDEDSIRRGNLSLLDLDGL